MLLPDVRERKPYRLYLDLPDVVFTTIITVILIDSAKVTMNICSRVVLLEVSLASIRGVKLPDSRQVLVVVLRLVRYV